ncbi:NAD-dependent epimerase/dehydratase [Candidatus Regiella insecticola LSR1]|uniref:NAD-dependent epimerase/dehydratase n=1 Tax=Candidatus Regiella insecticola LSR1 TaxID=663321 RepID=E0WS46_9ENTR|nr:NAD(P)-dependent oxidoreductase [Candidatus Regiella insecticola]EFL92180.1 NAD-dependent epimerase/dehydratase [Candidatus Regiella insecticola LSR1]
MKILVTGATSGLGRNAVEWLLQEGHQVHASGRDTFAGQQLSKLGAKFTSLDLATATAEQCRHLVKGCDIVWHCAAKSSPWGSRVSFYAANVVATEKLAKAAGKERVKRFIHISTPSIYFDFQRHHDIEENYRPKKFVNHYAESKFIAEQRIRQILPDYPGTTYIILRPRGIFGAHDRVLLPRILSQLKSNNGVLYLPRAGHVYVDVTFVLNVVHAMNIASQNKQLTSGAAFNITNHQPLYLADMLQQLFSQQMGIHFQIRSISYPLLYALASGMELLAYFTGKAPKLTRYIAGTTHFDMTLSQTKAIGELGYHPGYSMNQAIELTGKALKDEMNGSDHYL